MPQDRTAHAHHRSTSIHTVQSFQVRYSKFNDGHPRESDAFRGRRKRTSIPGANVDKYLSMANVYPSAKRNLSSKDISRSGATLLYE